MNGVTLGVAALVSLLTAHSFPACSAEEVRQPVEEDAVERSVRAGGGWPFPRGGEVVPVAGTGAACPSIGPC